MTGDPFLDKLRAEGFDLDIGESTERTINVPATLRMLKRRGISIRALPSGLVGRAAKLREICEARGVEPIWRDHR